MNHRTLLALVMVFLAQLCSCSDYEHPETKGFLYSKDLPVVTGIAVTTESMPDGTGEVIGTPAYRTSPNSVNAFPNPFIEPDTITQWVYSPTHLVFSRIPIGSKVVIVNARWEWEKHGTGTTFGGATISSSGTQLVRTLLKVDVTRYLSWDLTDDRGFPIPTGVYRAYYFGDSVDGVKFIDIAVKRGYKLFINF
jgi:hypothetical protein